MIHIPLPTRSFTSEEIFQINLELDTQKKYKIAISSIYFDIRNYNSINIGTIHCNAIDCTDTNPDQILTRITRSANTIQTVEWYKIDMYHLKYITLKLDGIKIGPVAITLAIKEYGKKEDL